VSEGDGVTTFHIRLTNGSVKNVHAEEVIAENSDLVFLGELGAEVSRLSAYDVVDYYSD
jgi:hypothetical protein